MAQTLTLKRGADFAIREDGGRPARERHPRIVKRTAGMIQRQFLC
jgi:hypothetical protein